MTELPEPVFIGLEEVDFNDFEPRYGYTADQMHDYTRAVRSERDALNHNCMLLGLELDAMTAERDALRRALERLRKMCNPEMSHQETLMVKVIDEALRKELK